MVLAASMIDGTAGALPGMEAGQMVFSGDREARRFRARLRAMVSRRVPMDAGAGPVTIAIATGASVIRNCAATLRTRRLPRCHPPFRRPGAVRRSPTRTIEDRYNRGSRVYNRHRSRATRGHRLTWDRCREASARGVSGRETRPLHSAFLKWRARRLTGDLRNPRV